MEAKLRRERENSRLAIFTQIPILIIILSLYVYPLIYSIWLSFHKLYIYESWIPTPVGFQNYIKLFFEDPLLGKLIYNSIIWVVGSNIGHFTLGLLFAILMNQKFRGRSIFRGIFFIPWVVPVVVVGVVWRWMLHPDWGLYNGILRMIGLLGKKDYIDWLGDPHFTWFSVIYVNWWKAYPFMYINFLAALQSIPEEIIESCKIDGANALQRFRYIIWPMILPVSLLMLLLGTVWTFINFNMIWLLTSGGPGYETTTYGPYTYMNSFQYWRLGYGAAVGVAGLVLCLIFTVIYVWFFLRRGGIY